MGKEFKVIKETATISSTLAELVAVNRIICHEIPSADFRAEYDSLLGDIFNSYQAFLDLMTPLTQCLQLATFNEQFAAASQQFEENYQATHSISRVNAEFTFEKYLQFRKRKETKTSYPPIKAAFERLHDLIDKWIDNDIWLAMSMDTVFKFLAQILVEVKDLQKKDPEAAFDLYNSCIGAIAPYLAMIDSCLDSVAEQISMAEMAEA